MSLHSLNINIICIVALVSAGLIIGRRLARYPQPFCLLASIPPFILMILIALPNFFPKLGYLSFFDWLLAGYNERIIFAGAVSLMLTVPMLRLPQRRVRLLTGFFMFGVIFWYSVLPMLYPWFVRGELCRLQTRLDSGGFCLQQTNYTCGPAAAVSALHQFGITAQEGHLAILAQSTPLTGTPQDLLTHTLQQQYGPCGLQFDYRGFDTIEQLQAAGLTLAIIKQSFMVDHWVAVLEVTNDKIVLADPMYGHRVLSRSEFLHLWRHCGIVIQKTPSPPV